MANLCLHCNQGQWPVRSASGPLVSQVWSVRVAVIFAEVERILLLDSPGNRFSILSINSSNEATRAATFSIHKGRKDPDGPTEWEELKREQGLWLDMQIQGCEAPLLDNNTSSPGFLIVFFHLLNWSPMELAWKPYRLQKHAVMLPHEKATQARQLL